MGSQLSWPAPPVEWTELAKLIESAVYSPNGSRVVTGSVGKTLQIWDAETSATVGDLLKGHTDPVNSVAYSPDGQIGRAHV